MSKYFSFLFVLMLTVVLYAAAPQAAAGQSADQGASSSLPQSGVLSQSMRGGYRSGKVDLPWGEKTGINNEAPVSGSVSRVSEREWRMRLFNNSDDTFSVDVRVVQKNSAGSTVKTDSFSYTLRSKQSAERTVSSTANVADAELQLLRWRNMTPKKEGQAGQDTGAQGGTEAAK